MKETKTNSSHYYYMIVVGLTPKRLVCFAPECETTFRLDYLTAECNKISGAGYRRISEEEFNADYTPFVGQEFIAPEVENAH